MSTHSDTTVYAGSLSDGRTAAAMPVEVRLAPGGIEIAVAGERQPLLEWPYAGLRSNTPLSPDTHDVVLRHEPGGLHTLHVGNPAFCRSLCARAGALSRGSQRLRALRPGLAVTGMVAAIAASVWLLDLRPLDRLARAMPYSTREAMGRNVVKAVAGSKRVCETAAGRAALDRLTQRLLLAAPDQAIAIRVVMMDWDLVNAFAAPGGQLIVTRGLVQAAGSPDEVAGVLAHELGHAIEMHPEVTLFRVMALSFAADLFTAGGSSASTLGATLLQLRYSREAEREADAHAIGILKNAGISAKGFGDFFERIEAKMGGKRRPDPGRPEQPAGDRRTGLGTRLMAIVSTHPLTDERIAMVRKQPAYPATPALSDADWQALRQMCGYSPARPTAPYATPPGPRPQNPRPPDLRSDPRLPDYRRPDLPQPDYRRPPPLPPGPAGPQSSQGGTNL